MSEIAQAIRTIVKSDIKIQTQVGTVKSVDETEMTCDVAVDGKADRLGVRLRSIIDEEELGLLIVPEVGSKVLISVIDNKDTACFVSAFSTVKSVKILTDTIELAGNKNGGLIIWNELKAQLDKNKARVDALFDAINNGVAIAQDGGAGLQTSMKAFLALAINTEDYSKSSILNDKVKHG